MSCDHDSCHLVDRDGGGGDVLDASPQLQSLVSSFLLRHRLLVVSITKHFVEVFPHISKGISHFGLKAMWLPVQWNS